MPRFFMQPPDKPEEAAPTYGASRGGISCNEKATMPLVTVVLLPGQRYQIEGITTGVAKW